MGGGGGRAALLHDTVEDTDTTFQEIGDNFGEEVEGKYLEWGGGSSGLRGRWRAALLHDTMGEGSWGGERGWGEGQ